MTARQAATAVLLGLFVVGPAGLVGAVVLALSQLTK